jgi:hypothetical protein
MNVKMTYDAENHQTGYILEYWSGGEWVNNGKHVYTYDANGNLAVEIYQSWNAGESSFQQPGLLRIVAWQQCPCRR